MTLCCGFEVQKPTQALMSVKGSANTCDLIPKWARSLAVGNCSWDINRAPHPLHKKTIQISKLIFDTLLWAWDTETHPGTYVSQRARQYLLEVQTLTQTLKSVIGPWSTFDLIPKWERTLSFEIFHGVFIEPPTPSTKKIKYQSWYLTPCCGHEVEKPIHALKSVKDSGNTFDLNPKWARTVS